MKKREMKIREKCDFGLGEHWRSVQLPSNPQDGASVIQNTRYATVGDSTFFRGQISTSTDDTALLFSTDTQMQLLQDACVVFVDSTFRVVPALSVVHHFRSPCRLLVSSVLCPDDQENNWPVSRSAWTPASTGTTVCSHSANCRLRGCSSSCLSCWLRRTASELRLLVSLCTGRHPTHEEIGTAKGLHDRRADAVGVSMCSVSPSAAMQWYWTWPWRRETSQHRRFGV